MEPYRKICEILFMDTDNVTVAIENNKTFQIKRAQIPEFARVGDFLLHCEHGFYDVVDKNENFIFR